MTTTQSDPLNENCTVAPDAQHFGNSLFEKSNRPM